MGGLTDFMKKFLGGLKAILTAEAGGQKDFSGPKKTRFPGAFPVNFGHSLRNFFSFEVI